jgi:hypothetical protein
MLILSFDDNILFHQHIGREIGVVLSLLALSSSGAKHVHKTKIT